MNGSLWKDDYHASGNWDTVCYTAFVRYLKLISTFQVYSKLQNRTLSYHTDYNIFAGMAFTCARARIVAETLCLAVGTHNSEP